MEIGVIAVGGFAVNCYVVYEKGRGIVIDPGADAKTILAFTEQQGLEIEAIINTHGHFDHIGANGAIKNAFDAPLYIHWEDEPCLKDAKRNLSVWAGLEAMVSPPADYLLSGGEVLEVAGLRVEVLHTPGHSPGSICLSLGGVLFTGDTLFAGSVGRTDFPGASGEKLMDSLHNVIMPLPLETVVYPGHGPASRLEAEMKHNPFLRC
ncbi:MAG: MBL fold metallo-hydrolase [Firmicutes bacterium]|jgi:hydroxyacylglutathione hydrolase|nr:MBL fold metallo-hydrolase [Bacillota bacterium]